MPNHCTNSLSCTSGKTIGSIIKPYITDDDHGSKFFDFNKIIPEPYGIKVSSKLIDMVWQHSIPDEDKIPQTAIDKINEALEIIKKSNKEKYGSEDAYNFHVDNWDTKWNSYDNWTFDNGFDNIEDLDVIGFQTAWSPPINVIRQLAKLTGESLRISYYDEGWMFGGEYLVNPDGSEVDNCYQDIDDCPDHLKEELDVQYYLDCRKEEDED